MTDIKIRVFGQVATTDGTVWKSEKKVITDYLNAISNRGLIVDYYPDKALALLDIAQKADPKIEVLSISNQPKYEKGKVY